MGNHPTAMATSQDGKMHSLLLTQKGDASPGDPYSHLYYSCGVDPFSPGDWQPFKDNELPQIDEQTVQGIACAPIDDDLHVLAVTDSNCLYHVIRSADDDDWLDWEKVPGTKFISVSCSASGEDLVVVAVTIDLDVKVNIWVGNGGGRGKWGKWKMLQSVPSDD